MPHIVDSSGWIEYFTSGPGSKNFTRAIENTADLIVPAITITEVYRWVLREAAESDALAAAAAMKQGHVIPLDDRLAILAADTSHRLKLPLADGIIYTTAIQHSATLLTQDADLENLPRVQYFRHPNRK